jgi:hypothetical protein
MYDLRAILPHLDDAATRLEEYCDPARPQHHQEVARSMTQQGSRGVVVPFTTVGRACGAADHRNHRSAPPAVASAVPSSHDAGRDEALNAEWNALLDLTVQACTWRDPESLAAVEAVLARLTRETLREWSR